MTRLTRHTSAGDGEAHTAICTLIPVQPRAGTFRGTHGGGTTRVPGVDYTLIGLATAVVLVLVAVSASVSRRETERRQVRLALIERKLDAVLDHLGVEVPEPHLQQIEALLRRGKTIEAIKAYREATGAGLREAKEAVDRLSARG
jgi:ribosomal protein L7/L12